MSKNSRSRPVKYSIYIKEPIPERWSAWFEGFTVRNLKSGEAVLSGPVADQSALHGLLAKIRDLNLTLISVTQTSPPQYLEYKPAEQEQYEEFLQLTQDQASGYLECTLDLMKMTREEYSQLFRSRGQMYGIYMDSQAAGFFWIEEREKTLHLHGLILKKEFQGQGIGTQVLYDLEARYGDRMDCIELGVHESNVRAKKLYERLGYETVKNYSDSGFDVMQKKLSRM
jgi:ribosomal protein S18 acetylase RimI-like enzyme